MGSFPLTPGSGAWFTGLFWLVFLLHGAGAGAGLLTALGSPRVRSLVGGFSLYFPD